MEAGAVVFVTGLMLVVVALALVIGHRWKELIMSDNQERLDQLGANLARVGNEIKGEITKLKDRVAAGEPLDFGPVESLVADLDAVVPDEPAEEPEPNPEPDVPAEEPVEDGGDEVASDPASDETSST